MKKSILAFCIFLAACGNKLNEKEKIYLAGQMIEQLQQRSSYADSLKVEVFLMDENAQNNLVQIPGGGYAFSKQYKEKIATNKPLAKLVEQCNVSVLAYGTLKSYVAKDLLRKIPGRKGDSLMKIFSKLR